MTRKPFIATGMVAVMMFAAGCGAPAGQKEARAACHLWDLHRDTGPIVNIEETVASATDAFYANNKKYRELLVDLSNYHDTPNVNMALAVDADCANI